MCAPASRASLPMPLSPRLMSLASTGGSSSLISQLPAIRTGPYRDDMSANAAEGLSISDDHRDDALFERRAAMHVSALGPAAPGRILTEPVIGQHDQRHPPGQAGERREHTSLEAGDALAAHPAPPNPYPAPAPSS